MLSEIQSVAASRTAASARSEVEMDLVARRKEDVAHRGDRCAHEQAQPLALRAEEGVDGHVVRDFVRAQAELETRQECCPGQRDADDTHDDRREAASSIRQSFTIARSVYWRPIRGNSPVTSCIR